MVPSRVLPSLLSLGLALFTACGGGGGGPAGPGPVGSPSPVGGSTVQVIVFYDENADGSAQIGEPVRVPNVEVTIGGRTARSQTGTGVADVSNVPDGSHAVSVAASSLPPFYRPGAPVSLTTPLGQGSRIFVPVTLAIGSNRPNVYMAFGDSITSAEALPGDQRYPSVLEGKLAPHFSGAEVSNRGADGTNTFEARERIKRNLDLGSPAYTLILYGTNDWHDPLCQDDPRCHTVPNLRLVIQAVKDHGSLPMIATLTPVNPTLGPAGRNRWIQDVNDLIRPMAQQEGAFLVDLAKAFADRGGDPSRFFLGDVHLNREGAAVVAEAFFQAIAFGRTAPLASAQGSPRLLARP